MTRREQYTISTGRSRLETSWKERRVSWAWLRDRLGRVLRTRETAARYAQMGKAAKGAAKDHGGFVGGALQGGTRKSSTVLSRSLLTLDIDYARPDTLGVISDTLAGTAWCVYSTHSSTAQAPRYRLVVPLSRDVTPEEYVAVGRRVAGDVGIDIFDDSTYEPARLMYWPSAPSDGPFVFRYAEGDPLDVTAELERYTDWRDTSEWPVSARVQRLAGPSGRKMEDPALKGGLIGAFCRAYTLSDAIDAFLPDVYVPAGNGRYTYTGGSTAGGLVVYDDKWAFSHHGTDPAGGREVNAFDLVRLHRYGALDGKADPDTPVNRLPSFKAMSDFVSQDPKVKGLTAREKVRELAGDFGALLDEEDEDDKDWTAKLQMDRKRQNILPSPYNFELICRHDPRLAGSTRRDLFVGRDRLLKDLPWMPVTQEHRNWGDVDDKGLVNYISEVYSLQGKQAICDAHDLVMSQSSFHPVRDYLDGLRWDGTPRLDTLLCDYLGAPDDELTRTMTRKHFVAAVARVMSPGCKYDYVLTLIGSEGLGKSALIRTMAGGDAWFSDSIVSIEGKEAMEQLRGKWLIEMGELTNYKKSTSEAYKAFLSKQEDSYRPAYAHKTEVFPRQCVFFATTNERSFLKGDTGNRRFWVVECGEDLAVKSWAVDLPRERDQIWAEAVERWKEGEKLFLVGEMQLAATRRQEEHNEVATDERVGLIEAFLREELPMNWDKLTRDQRQEWFRHNASVDPNEPRVRRETVCAVEVLVECLGQKTDEKTRYRTKEINQILRRMPGLEYIGRTRDKVYGLQHRYRINDNEQEAE